MVWQRIQHSPRWGSVLPTTMTDGTSLPLYDEKSKRQSKWSKHRILVLGSLLLMCLMGVKHGEIFKDFTRSTKFYDGDDDESNNKVDHVGFSSTKTKSLNGCPPEEVVTKRIVIVGAGAAGLTAAKRLQNAPNYANAGSCWTTEVTVLEASNRFGGRFGKDDDFTVYPVDLGASWVYDEKRLSLIAQEKNVEKSLKKHLVAPFLLDNFETYTMKWSGGKKEIDLSYIEQKLWSNFTWYDFFEQKVVPALRKDQIIFNCPVDKIVHRKEQGDLTVSCGERLFVADHVIVTASLAVLKDNLISFTPPLPSWMVERRNPMWRGFKIFFEFSEKFYDDYFVFSAEDGELDWWDYSVVHVGHGQEPNILAGYYMGEVHDKFEGMTEDQIVKEVLRDLENIYGENVATNTYVGHKLINWNENPFVRGTYAGDCPPSDRAGPQVLYGGRLFIAGEAFPVPRRHVGWVDGAALSGLHAAETILHDIDASKVWSSIPKKIWKAED